MATTTRKNGEWSSWTITRIRGEKGDPGQNGTNGKDGKDGSSVKILGTLTSSDELKTIAKKEAGDGYLIDGNLWVYTDASGDGSVAGFINVGKIKGEDGKDGTDGAQVYLHIKYATKVTLGDNWEPASEADVKLTANNGETPGPWMGQYSDYNDKDSDNVLDYTWFSVDAQNAVATEIGKYKITSNSILGKTITSTHEVDLVQGTSYTEINDDGTLGDKELTSSKGPAWQISDSGQGHLAKGNIRWNKNGDVEFGPNVVLKWSAGIDEAKSAAQGAAEAAATAQSAANAAQGAAEAAQNTANEAKDVNYITTISKNAITTEFLNTKEITAKDISADKITGKTLQSSDATNAAWRLNSDGSGRLANGNITWNSNGNVEFGSGVKLTWNDEWDSKIPDGGVDEAAVEGIVKKTEIDGSKITTGIIDADRIDAGSITADKIDATNLHVKAANIDGTLSASKIDAENLVVTKLNTKPSVGNLLTAAQVRIQDNDITVTGDNTSKPVLKISGTNIPEDFKNTITASTKRYTFSNNVSNNFNISSTITPIDNVYPLITLYDITASGGDVNLSSKMRMYKENGIQCNFVIDSYRQETNGNTGSGLNGGIGNVSFGGFNVGIRCIVKQGNVEKVSYEYAVSSLSISGDSEGGLFDPHTIGGDKSKQITINIPFDTICDRKYYGSDYTKEISLVISNKTANNISNATIRYQIASTSGDYILQPLITNMPNMNIHKDCFRYFINDYNYLDVDSDGYFTYYGPGKLSGFGVSKADGVWFNVGGQKFKLSDMNQSTRDAAKAAENANKYYYRVSTDVYGDGTEENPGLLDRTDKLTKDTLDISNDLYGADGNSGIKSVATGAQSLAAEALNGATVAQGAAEAAQGAAEAAQSTADKASKSAGTALTNANTALTNANTANEAANAAHVRIDTTETNIANLNNTTPKIFNQSTVFNDVFCKTGSKFALMYISPGKTPTYMSGSYNSSGIQKMNYTSSGGGIYFKNITDMPANTTICVSTNTFTVNDVKYLVEPIDNLIFAESTNSAGAKINKVHGSLGVVTTSSKSVSGPIRITNMDTGATVICELKVAFAGVA
jgi:hypothetical protein